MAQLDGTVLKPWEERHNGTLPDTLDTLIVIHNCRLVT